MSDSKQQIIDRKSDIEFLINAVKIKTKKETKGRETQTPGYFEIESSLELKPATEVTEEVLVESINNAMNYRGFTVEQIKTWKENEFEWGIVVWVRKDNPVTAETHKQRLLDRISQEHDRLSKRDRSPWDLLAVLGELATMKLQGNNHELRGTIEDRAVAVAAMALNIALEAGDGGDRDEA